MSFKTIVAPVDFSSRTESEAEHAVNVAKHLNAPLVFLHVIPTYHGPPPIDSQAAAAYSHPFSADIETGVRTAMQSLADRLGVGSEAQCVVLSGDPATRIEEIAAQTDAGLIVMPTAGRGRFRRRLLGSVTTKVLHDLTTPVFTGVHLREVDPVARHPYRRMACKLDLADGDDEVLRWATDFAGRYDAELYLVSVLPFLDTLGAAPSLPEPLRAGALAKARERVQAIAAAQGAHAKSDAIGGPIEKVLPAYLDSHAIDILITGRTRRQDVVGVFGLHRDLIDTVCCTPCPVITV